MTKKRNENILLALLPFWDPQIPPLGISCLKSHLERHGFRAKTVDLNIEPQFRDVIKIYFEILKQHLPANKQGNFYKIAHEVMQNHMMAHTHYKDKTKYLELVKILVYKTFYTHIDTNTVLELCEIVSGFYTRLERHFLNLLQEEQPGVLGISVFGGTLAASLHAFKLTKEKYPHIKTVMGGAIFSDQLHTDSPNFKFFLERTPYIDKIIVGEGENLMLKYLLNELPHSQRVYRLKDINHDILDVSSAAVPDFSDLDTRFYPYMSTYTSRSCPFQCSFCSETILWGKYRRKKTSKIVGELTHLSKKYNSQLFMLGDSLINPTASDISREFAGTGTSVYWDAYLRADNDVCNRENALLWRRGGFYRARLGVESGSQHVLDLMGKKITLHRIKEALSSLANAGIKTTTYWVVGHPGETEEDFQATLRLIEEMRYDIYEADCTPFQYFLTGQSGSGDWAGKSRPVSLYPEDAEEMLILRAWTLDSEPSRQEAYKRMNRFVEHCNKLGVPNPYSLKETYSADERWKKIQKNAVPPFVEFTKGTRICENKEAKRLIPAKEKPNLLDEIEFGF